MIILTGNSNRPLVAGVFQYLSRTLTDQEKVIFVPAEVGRFGNGEVRVYLGKPEENNVRGQDVFIIQSTNAPAENIIELELLIDAAARAAARSITVVFPYFAYAYQDRKDKPRVPISAKVMAEVCAPIDAVNRVICFELHSGQVQGFFRQRRVENVYLRQVLVSSLQERINRLRRPLLLVAPDAGSTKLCRAYARRLGTGITVVDKIHDPDTDEVRAVRLLGDPVKGAVACILDDSIRSARTVIFAADLLKKAGAKEVWAYAVFPDFTSEAPGKLARCCAITEIGVTDTILLKPGYRKTLGKKLHIISAADFIGETIKRVHREESLSSLF